MARLSRTLALAVAVASVVIVAADRPLPGPGPIQGVEDLGPVRWDHRILGRDGGLSARWRDTTVWVFGDTITSVAGGDGDRWSNNSSAVTTDLDASDGIALVPPKGVEHLDGAGLPGEYLPLSAAERAFNVRNDPARCGTAPVGECGQQYFLWPGPVVPDPGRHRILFFLTAGRRGGSIEAFQDWGSGIVAWDAESDRTTRPEQGPGAGVPADERWTMFGPGETRYGTMAFTVGDTLYAYGCDNAGPFRFHCRVARVPLGRALDRAAWRFYAGRRGWSADPRRAVRIFDGGHSGTVFYNRHLHRYMAVYGFTTAEYRTAPHPWGPWSPPVRMFSTVPPVKDFNYFVLAHPEYGDGRVLYLTYSRPTEIGWELRLTRVTLT